MWSLKYRVATPTIETQSVLVVRTLLASQHMINAQNMIDEHFAKSGVFDIWKESE